MISYNFKINKLAEDVYEIENFLDNSELSQMLETINGAKEPDWYDTTYINNEEDFWYGKSLFLGERHKISKTAILDKINFIFPSYFYCDQQIKISRFKQNEVIGKHRDNDTTPKGYYLGYGVVVYYNDNYLGGEIDYPEIGITIKPKAGSALLHGGEVMHGSLPVLSNSQRYFSTIFMRGNDDHPTLLNKDLFK
jgi:hypothetical protein